MFIKINHDIGKLIRVETPEGRKYQTPEGKSYPSVTSVVGLHGKKEIIEWRKRVGEEEANRISSRAARRGTTLHSLCEAYLKNEEVNPSIFDVESFNIIKPCLDKINNIHCLEDKLYSDFLEVAGTTDCIAEYDGKLAVIDFKTSNRIKTKEDIPGYFMQSAAYAVMFEERTQIPVSHIYIIMVTDEAKEPIVFHEKRDNWINSFIELRKEFRVLKGV